MVYFHFACPRRQQEKHLPVPVGHLHTRHAHLPGVEEEPSRRGDALRRGRTDAALDPHNVNPSDNCTLLAVISQKHSEYLTMSEAPLKGHSGYERKRDERKKKGYGKIYHTKEAKIMY